MARTGDRPVLGEGEQLAAGLLQLREVGLFEARMELLELLLLAEIAQPLGPRVEAPELGHSRRSPSMFSATLTSAAARSRSSSSRSSSPTALVDLDLAGVAKALLALGGRERRSARDFVRWVFEHHPCRVADEYGEDWTERVRSEGIGVLYPSMLETR
jgi:hypothetical protein